MVYFRNSSSNINVVQNIGSQIQYLVSRGTARVLLWTLISLSLNSFLLPDHGRLRLLSPLRTSDSLSNINLVHFGLSFPGTGEASLSRAWPWFLFSFLFISLLLPIRASPSFTLFSFGFISALLGPVQAYLAYLSLFFSVFYSSFLYVFRFISMPGRKSCFFLAVFGSASIRCVSRTTLGSAPFAEDTPDQAPVRLAWSRTGGLQAWFGGGCLGLIWRTGPFRTSVAYSLYEVMDGCTVRGLIWRGGRIGWVGLKKQKREEKGGCGLGWVSVLVLFWIGLRLGKYAVWTRSVNLLAFVCVYT